jgi:hypothetical protein
LNCDATSRAYTTPSYLRRVVTILWNAQFRGQRSSQPEV